MDVWDVMKAAGRRWYVTAPLLVIVAAVTVWVSLATPPEYRVTGHIAVIGPTVVHPDDETTVRHINPWSTTALAEAVSIRLDGKALADEMRAGAYEGEWQAAVTGNQPWIRLEVTASSVERATATAERLNEIVIEEMALRQDEYDVPTDDRVTTAAFKDGTNVETVTDQQRRALVAALGLGLLISFALVLGYDLLARRRQAQQQPAAEDTSVLPRVRYAYATEPQAPHRGNDHRRNGEQAPARDPVPAATTSVRGGNRPPTLGREVATTHGKAPEPGTRAPEDATIVLPLSNEPWARSAKSQGEPRG